MAYTITKTDGTTLTTINDGFLDTSTSLSLPGPNYVGYGQKLNENLVYLLENFAGNSSPTGLNVEGQLWYDKINTTLNVFTKYGYLPVAGVVVSGSRPVVQKVGDVWFNTATNQYYLYDGTDYRLVGPVYTKTQGVSGAIPVDITESLGTPHNALQLQFGNTVIAVISEKPTYAVGPGGGPTGFTYINPGITFRNDIHATINSDLVGDVTGNVVGYITGDVVGNLRGNVVASTLVGSLTGNVVATTLRGNLTGNTVTTNSVTTNFSTGNAVITGGYITGISNIGVTSATVQNLRAANAVITGGYINNIANISVTSAVVNNITMTTGTIGALSIGSAQVASGDLYNIGNINVTTIEADNISTGNAVITGGYINNIVNLGASTGSFQNLTASIINAQGGNFNGISNFNAFTAQTNNFSTGNAWITGGNLVSVPLYNNTITAANLVNATTATPATNNRSTAVATTAFVHNVMPTGAIIMWAGSINNIPSGWALCDGSNGTPDLRDRFIVGAGTANIGTTGGSATTTLTQAMLPPHIHSVSLTGNTNAGGTHSHIASVTETAHTHTYDRASLNSAAFNYNNAYPQNGTAYTYSLTNTSTTTGTRSTGLSVGVSQAADHTHSITITGNTGSIGSSTSFDTRPPYYTLCFLQKAY